MPTGVGLTTRCLNLLVSIPHYVATKCARSTTCLRGSLSPLFRCLSAKYATPQFDLGFRGEKLETSFTFPGSSPFNVSVLQWFSAASPFPRSRALMPEPVPSGLVRGTAFRRRRKEDMCMIYYSQPVTRHVRIYIHCTKRHRTNLGKQRPSGGSHRQTRLIGR